MPATASDFTTALAVGRPPNVARLFPNSKALLVSGKVIDRAMNAKGNALALAANGRNHFVIRGVLAAAQQIPRLARVPFIFLTSLTDRDTQRRGMTSGADDFLTKPFHPTELVDAIQARFRKLTTHGPDEAVMQSALARMRELLSGQEQALLGLDDPGAAALEAEAPVLDPEVVAARRWAEGWIQRVRWVFDEHNPQAIVYLKDRVHSKKQTIHATYLLSKLYFKVGDRPHAEAEFAVAESVLKMNIGLFRTAIEGESQPATVGRYPGLRARIIRLERKLEKLRQEQFG